MTVLIEEIAKLLAQQKLVPFFGAGLSRQHLGVAAVELAHEMARQIGAPPDTLLADLTDLFADQKGEDALVQFLKEKLIVSDLDEAKAPTHRLLLSLSLNLLYTTNQDNIFELTAARYKRPYRRVVTLQDLSDSIPGERLLIKFHGDLDVPDSLVFGSRSYQRRITAADHPLDIKLRSDLLGKQLLFLGYSIRDENVTKLIDSVQRVFDGHMPPSYLIAFEYDPSMKDLTDQFGIRVVDPTKVVPDPKNSAEAFERCLKKLCDETLNLQAKRGLQNLFSGGRINPRMLTDYELDSVTRIIDSEPFDTAVDGFRAIFDLSIVPEPFYHRAVELFSRLVGKADPAKDDELNALKYALFHFRVPPYLALEATAMFMAACNRRPVHEGLDDFGALVCQALPDEGLPVAASMAVAILEQRKQPITDGFRRLAMYWFQGYQDLPAAIQKNIELTIKYAWSGQTHVPSPLNTPRLMPTKGFHKMVDELIAQMPKQFRKPE